MGSYTGYNCVVIEETPTVNHMVHSWKELE